MAESTHVLLHRIKVHVKNSASKYWYHKIIDICVLCCTTPHVKIENIYPYGVFGIGWNCVAFIYVLPRHLNRFMWYRNGLKWNTSLLKKYEKQSGKQTELKITELQKKSCRCISGKTAVLNKGLLGFVVTGKQRSTLKSEFQKVANCGGAVRMFRVLPEDSVFLNPTSSFVGLLRSAVSAQSGPNEEGWLWAWAPRAPHQGRQRDGKG